MGLSFVVCTMEMFMGSVLPNESENVLNAKDYLREVSDLYGALVFKILLEE